MSADPLACTIEGAAERVAQIEAKTERLGIIVNAGVDLLLAANAEVYLAHDFDRVGVFKPKKARIIETFYFENVEIKMNNQAEYLMSVYKVPCPKDKQLADFRSEMGTGILSFEWITKRGLGQLMQTWYATDDDHVNIVKVPSNSFPGVSNDPFPHSLNHNARIAKYKQFCESSIKILDKRINELVDKVKAIITYSDKLHEPLKEKLKEMLSEKGETAFSKIREFVCHNHKNLPADGTLVSELAIKQAYYRMFGPISQDLVKQTRSLTRELRVVSIFAYDTYIWSMF